MTMTMAHSFPEAPARELAGKVAIVTGSTSGIGLGIAHAFAASGMNVMLNGFGDLAEIERIRDEIKSNYGVRTAYSAADMSKPGDIVQMFCEQQHRLIEATAALRSFPSGRVDVAGKRCRVAHDGNSHERLPLCRRAT